MQNTNVWAKAGVMVRESLNDNSAYAYTLITPHQGSAFQRRTNTGVHAVHTAGPNVTAPYWVRLDRSGDTFTSSVSSDGQNWMLVGSDTISMTSTVYVGLAVTAHNNSVLNTSTFANVNVVMGTNAGTGLPNGHYTLLSLNGGMAFDNSYGGGAGNHEQQYPSNGTGNQHWLIRKAAGGYYTITCDYNNLALDVNGQSMNSGATIVLQPSTGGDSQLWQIKSVDGYYIFINKHSGLVLDVKGASTALGAPIIQWTYHKGTNQQWYIKAVS
jgi:hypothetical protein